MKILKKKRKSKVDYSSPYEGAVGKSSDRETAKKKWMSKATKDEVDLGLKLTRDADGNFIARTKLSSPSNYKKGGRLKVGKRKAKFKDEDGNFFKVKTNKDGSVKKVKTNTRKSKVDAIDKLGRLHKAILDKGKKSKS